MDFGAGGYDTIEYVPTYNGNRDLPDDQRVSVEIVRLNTAQRLAMDSLTEAKLYTWRDQAMAGWLKDSAFSGAIPDLSYNVLHVFRVVAMYTRNWRNVLYDGQPLTDPLEICLRLPIPTGGEEVALIREVYDAVLHASELSGEQLKNFAGQCAGNISGITPTQGESAIAPPAGEGVLPRRRVGTQAARKGL